MSLLTDFKARFPTFDTAAADLYVPIFEPIVPAYYAVDYAESEVSKEATLNLLAHLITLETSGGSGAAQQLASQSVGSVSESYVTAPITDVDDAFFASTKYGQQFRRVTASRYGGLVV